MRRRTRYVTFFLFYVLSARIVLVAFSSQSPLAAMIMGGAAVVLAIVVWRQPEWAVYGFMVCIPLVSGLHMGSNLYT